MKAVSPELGSEEFCHVQVLPNPQLRNGNAVSRWRVPWAGRVWYPLVLRSVQSGPRRHLIEAGSLAGPREARPDRQVGCAEGPGRGAGPEGLRAGASLDREPVQPHSAFRFVCLLDGDEGCPCRGRRRPKRPVRAQRAEGDLKVTLHAASAGSRDRRTRSRRCHVH